MFRICCFNRTLYYYSLFGVVLLLLFVEAGAQGGVDSTGTGGRHTIQGRLMFPSGQRADVRLQIRLESAGFGDLSVLSDMNGNFSFRSLQPGNYTVVIEGGEFFESERESVFIEPATVSPRRTSGIIPISRPFNVQIYLRPKQTPGHNKPGVLNAALAGVPKTAVELYEAAQASARAGDHAKAIEQLKEALALHPGFGLAQNELGVQYLKRGELEKAAEALRSAITLMPEAFEPRLYLGIALLNQLKFKDAENRLREAIKINESSFTAHMYLGLTLVRLGNNKEAESEFRRAIELGGAKAGQAHYYLGGLYWHLKDYPRAVIELEKYLQLEPKAANAEKVRATIKELRSKS